MTDKSKSQKPVLSQNIKATESDARIAELNEEIFRLRGQLFKVRDELHGLKNSRVLGKIIKVRDRTGTLINNAGGVKNIPVHVGKKAFQKTRVTVAPAFPEPVRTAVKQSYRKVKKGVSKSRPIVQVSVTELENHKIADTQQLVSVVVPYYNRADTIDDTIASLQTQTFRDFEVIIVNDGSPEKESVEKLNHLDLDGLKARIINQENQGVAKARNNGIREASGKYIICLDSDDILVPTFIEKALCVLEARPDVALVTSHMDVFGVVNEVHKNAPYNPLELLTNNMVITAAAFRKEAWEATDGYKSDIGYEDWEFWLSLSERGFWGKLIPEELFVYRTSLQSRYIDDKDVHWNNLKRIKTLHPEYRKRVKQLLTLRQSKKDIALPKTTFVNMDRSSQYKQQMDKPNVMMTMSWMTFGGAETLVHNYCRELQDTFNITFVTGLKSKNEWENKFSKISPYIYHLPNLFEDSRLYIEFMSNYISTRDISILHIVHNGFVFDMLPELKARHPELKVVLTLFNDRVPEYVAGAVKYQPYIDEYVTDNQAVATSFEKRLKPGEVVTVIPNGIDAYNEFSPTLFNRDTQRTQLKLGTDDIAVFFVGRLSEEKNPDVFIEAAKLVIDQNEANNVKFYIIGDGPMRPEVEKLIKGAETESITYLGYQSAVASYLSAADIFVLPSSIEGFPLSILEAMAMEVAVIASDVGAVADVIESGVDGYVITPGSEAEIAETVNLLVADITKLNDIKAKGRKKVENQYSNRILGANYKKLYKRHIK